MSKSQNAKFGEIAIRHKLLSRGELKEYLREVDDDESLEEILVEDGLLSPREAKSVRLALEYREMRLESKLYCSLAVKNGFASKIQADACLDKQKELYLEEQDLLEIGQLMLELGYVDLPEDKALRLAIQRLNPEKYVSRRASRRRKSIRRSRRLKKQRRKKERKKQREKRRKKKEKRDRDDEESGKKRKRRKRRKKRPRKKRSGEHRKPRPRTSTRLPGEEENAHPETEPSKSRGEGARSEEELDLEALMGEELLDDSQVFGFGHEEADDGGPDLEEGVASEEESDVEYPSDPIESTVVPAHPEDSDMWDEPEETILEFAEPDAVDEPVGIYHSDGGHILEDTEEVTMGPLDEGDLAPLPDKDETNESDDSDLFGLETVEENLTGDLEGVDAPGSPGSLLASDSGDEPAEIVDSDEEGLEYMESSGGLLDSDLEASDASNLELNFEDTSMFSISLDASEAEEETSETEEEAGASEPTDRGEDQKSPMFGARPSDDEPDFQLTDLEPVDDSGEDLPTGGWDDVQPPPSHPAHVHPEKVDPNLCPRCHIEREPDLTVCSYCGCDWEAFADTNPIEITQGVDRNEPTDSQSELLDSVPEVEPVEEPEEEEES